MLSAITVLISTHQSTPYQSGLRKSINFTEGNRYQDFDSSVDKVAAYGLGALIAGGLAVKTGLFAKLLVMLVAFKKAIALGAVALGAAAVKLFRKKKDSQASPLS